MVFFRILLPDGRYGYTRNGEFKLDRDRQLVTSDGYRVEPNVFIPREGDLKTLKITVEGNVFINMPGEEVPREVGQMILYRFSNAPGLSAIGDNNFIETIASGESQPIQPGEPGAGLLRQGFIERSNVELVTELVNMITAQRAYEFNSRAIQTTDSMLGTAVGLKR